LRPPGGTAPAACVSGGGFFVGACVGGGITGYAGYFRSLRSKLQPVGVGGGVAEAADWGVGRNAVRAQGAKNLF
jgi:hypothetical protein